MVYFIGRLVTRQVWQNLRRRHHLSEKWELLRPEMVGLYEIRLLQSKPSHSLWSFLELSSRSQQYVLKIPLKVHWLVQLRTLPRESLQDHWLWENMRIPYRLSTSRENLVQNRTADPPHDWGLTPRILQQKLQRLDLHPQQKYAISSGQHRRQHVQLSVEVLDRVTIQVAEGGKSASFFAKHHMQLLLVCSSECLCQVLFAASEGRSEEYQSKDQ